MKTATFSPRYTRENALAGRAMMLITSYESGPLPVTLKDISAQPLPIFRKGWSLGIIDADTPREHRADYAGGLMMPRQAA